MSCDCYYSGSVASSSSSCSIAKTQPVKSNSARVSVSSECYILSCVFRWIIYKRTRGSFSSTIIVTSRSVSRIIIITLFSSIYNSVTTCVVNCYWSCLYTIKCSRKRIWSCKCNVICSGSNKRWRRTISCSSCPHRYI